MRWGLVAGALARTPTTLSRAHARTREATGDRGHSPLQAAIVVGPGRGEGWKDFTSDPDVPGIFQEAGFVGSAQVGGVPPR